MASGQPPDASLEDELRRMILSNVSIGSQAPQASASRGDRHQNENQAGYSPRGAHGPRGGYGRGAGRAAPGTENVNHWHNNAKPQYVAHDGTNRDVGQQWRGSSRGHGQHFQQPRQQYLPNHPHSQPAALIDPNSFGRLQYQQNNLQHHGQDPRLFNNNGRHPPFRGPDRRAEYLDDLVRRTLPLVQIQADEMHEKERFRNALESVVKTVCQERGMPGDITLASFGSLSSGFAKKNADMDLAIVDRSAREGTLDLEEGGGTALFETIQERLLEQGIGARLLSKTRVPILKICELPGTELLEALRKQRDKDEALESTGDAAVAADAVVEAAQDSGPGPIDKDTSSPKHDPQSKTGTTEPAIDGEHPPEPSQATSSKADPQHKPAGKKWSREKALGPLDFPKAGVGVQCDINLSNALGLHNSQLLRCYAQCDPRVRQMVLFVKSWASSRKINSSYSGTLSSYGYVLMVLHYLINVSQPPVLPNLQLEAARAGMAPTVVDGWNVQFWADEASITERSRAGMLTRNRETVGALLVGFFQYYAVQTRGHGFSWTQEVLSLRTPGGVISKTSKGWTGARTVKTDDEREVRNRYLFAIEDPFELVHNVARTVTHNGIVAIRDEFRRAYRILGTVMRGEQSFEGDLMEPLTEQAYEMDSKTDKAGQNGVPGKSKGDLPTVASQSPVVAVTAEK